MNNQIKFILTSLTIFTLFSVFSSPAMADFRFVSWGDTKSARSVLTAESNQINNLNNTLNPKIILTIYAGDLVDSWSTNNIQAWISAINSTVLQYTFPVRGNHDSGSSNDWSSYFNQAATVNYIGGSHYIDAQIPLSNMTFSFDYQNSHFVGIDVLGDVTRMSSSQISWLDSDLTAAENRGLTHAFLYWHGPFYAMDGHCCPTAPSALVNVINKHPIVSATFHGHEHINTYVHIDSSRVSGVTHEFEQFITGDAGAGVSSCRSGRFTYCMTGAHGFGVVTVSGNSFTMDFYKVNNNTPDWSRTFTKGSAPPTVTPGGPSPTPTRTPTPTPTRTPTPTPTSPPQATATPIPTAPAGCQTSDSSWQNFSLPTQTGSFTVEYDATPNGSGIDSLTMLSFGAGGAWSDYAALVRFNPNGQIDVRNGGSYTADTTVNYSSGSQYHFRLDINVPSKTYSVYVTHPGGSQQQLAYDYSFRSEQSTISSINNWGIRAASGSHQVCNFQLDGSGSPPTLPPTITAKTFLADYGGFQQVLDRIADGLVNVLDLFHFLGPSLPASTPPESEPTATPTPTRTPSPTPSGPTPTVPPPGSGQGIWISKQEIMALPISGDPGCSSGSSCAVAWNSMLNVARGSWDPPELYNQDSHHPQQTMAAALVCARKGNGEMCGNQSCCQRTEDAIMSIIVTGPVTDGPQDGRSLALGRNLAAYVISADLINLESINLTKNQQFRNFLTNVRFWTNTEGRSLVQCHDVRPNNWGTMCGSSRIAADLYLNDQDDLQNAINTFKGYLGNRSVYSNFKFQDGAISWMCDPNNPRPINPPNCSKNGCDLSGAPVDDVQRARENLPPEDNFICPPEDTHYAWGGFSAAVAQAELLHQAGHPAYEWETQAIRRGMHFLQHLMPNSISNPTHWMPWVVNKHYPDFDGQPFDTVSRSGYGRLIDWTFWTHQK